jgi:hypothetical protein
MLNTLPLDTSTPWVRKWGTCSYLSILPTEMLLFSVVKLAHRGKIHLG